jgi:hypothetical protein
MVGLSSRILIALKIWPRITRGLGVDFFSSPADATGNDERQNELRTWYLFGALGPAIGDFLPNELSATIGGAGRTPYYAAWRLVFEIAVGNGDPNPDTSLPGAAPTLRTLIGLLERMKQLVAARDFDGMVALRDSGALDQVQSASRDLGKILRFFSDTSNLGNIATLLGAQSMPRIDNTVQTAPPSAWTGRDFLHWKRTGEFTAALWADASKSGDPRFVAYALGWLVCYATLVCGSGFISSVAGSSYRTYWWRTRWIANFVDAWLCGFYGSGSTIADDGNPDKPFEQWPSLCSAGLHNLVDLTSGLDPEATALDVVMDSPDHPLPRVLPTEFTDYWIGAWTRVYGTTTAPLFTADRLQIGYLMTWLVLWFQTSGDVIGCNPQPPAAPPTACGSNPQPPDWIDPTQTNPVTGSLFTPPTPNAEHDPDIAEVVCGIILAILGLALTVFGGGAVGIPLLVGGIVLAVDGEKQLNWDDLECQLYWLSMYVYTGLNALHQVTVLGGFQHPYARDFEVSTQTLPSINGSLQLSYDSAPSTCRSKALDHLCSVWNGALLDWVNYASNPPETPTNMVWPLDGLWPSAIVDDDTRNPVASDILTAPASYDAGVVHPFGPAVQNALKLLERAIRGDLTDLPDWNLDGDRGLGWLTWTQNGPYQLPVPTSSEV